MSYLTDRDNTPVDVVHVPLAVFRQHVRREELVQRLLAVLITAVLVVVTIVLVKVW